MLNKLGLTWWFCIAQLARNLVVMAIERVMFARDELPLSVTHAINKLVVNMWY